MGIILTNYGFHSQAEESLFRQTKEIVFDLGHDEDLNEWGQVVYCVIINVIHILHPYFHPRSKHMSYAPDMEFYHRLML